MRSLVPTRSSGTDRRLAVATIAYFHAETKIGSLYALLSERLINNVELLLPRFAFPFCFVTLKELNNVVDNTITPGLSTLTLPRPKRRRPIYNVINSHRFYCSIIILYNNIINRQATREVGPTRTTDDEMWGTDRPLY